MTDARFLDEQRLAFGRVAELYDRARPSYPPEAIDSVLDYAGLKRPARILEIGAGTGKATLLFADRGLAVLALEPSHEMAEVARRNCARYPDVTIIESDFERWPGGEKFSAAVSVQAWHWLAPDVRYAKAHQALRRGGTLAAIWTLPDWTRCELRPALRKAYGTNAPTMTTSFPMHPDSELRNLTGDWLAETSAAGGFTDERITTFSWSQRYTGADYAQLLQTHQDHILLESGERGRLTEAVAEAIDAAGGVVSLPYVTFVCLTRAG